MDPIDAGELIKAARTAATSAYCPYSNYAVGAALRSRDGRIFTGCNVENACYGLTLCAERVAIHTAVASGVREFSAIAVVSGGPAMPLPCGACRQVLSEFCRPDFRVFIALVNRPDLVEEYILDDILPRSFKL